MNKRLIYIICVFLIYSCKNEAGYEFMTNMYRSPSLETYGSNTVFADSINARIPVKGTISRGNLSTFYYQNTLEDYMLAGEKAINPFLP